MPKRPEPAYLESIGWALYSFQALEWRVVHILKDHGHDIAKTSSKMAGQIAKGFQAAWKSDPRGTELSDAFAALVQRRNDLAHARPATMDGEDRNQRLYRWEIVRSPKKAEWVDDHWLDTFAGDVAKLSQEISRYTTQSGD